MAAEDAIFTADVGSPTMWAARYLTMNGRRRLLGSFNHGSMANAMPQAIGAQLAAPGRQVISLSGDGGFSMLMGDFLTIRQHKLPVKIIVFNNGALGFVELEMKAAGLVGYGTTLDNPDFAKMAEAVGIRGFRVGGSSRRPNGNPVRLSSRWTSPRGRSCQSARTFHTSKDRTGPGQRIWFLYVASDPQRKGR